MAKASVPLFRDPIHDGAADPTIIYNRFQWKGYYWMLTDPWEGLGVYRSRDAERWERQQNILQTGGSRPDDATRAGHADVLVTGGRAFVLYFTRPGRTTNAQPTVSDVQPYAERRSSLQLAELEFTDGMLTCNRDAEVDVSFTAEDNGCEHALRR